MVLKHPQEEVFLVLADFLKSLFPKAVHLRWTVVPAFRWLSVLIITEDSEKGYYHSVQGNCFNRMGCFRNKSEAITLATL